MRLLVCIRSADLRGAASKHHQANDVIEIFPDGHHFGSAELHKQDWRIIDVPDFSDELKQRLTMQGMLYAVMPPRPWARRANALDWSRVTDPEFLKFLADDKRRVESYRLTDPVTDDGSSRLQVVMRSPPDPNVVL